MIVEKEWFASLCSLPIFVTLALMLNRYVENVILYFCLLIVGIRVGTVCYYSVVTRRVSVGGSIGSTCLQWLVIQVVLIASCLLLMELQIN